MLDKMYDPDRLDYIEFNRQLLTGVKTGYYIREAFTANNLALIVGMSLDIMGLKDFISD